MSHFNGFYRQLDAQIEATQKPFICAFKQLMDREICFLSKDFCCKWSFSAVRPPFVFPTTTFGGKIQIVSVIIAPKLIVRQSENTSFTTLPFILQFIDS